jgi:hypothetical protein
MYPKLGLNSLSSCLCLPSAQVCVSPWQRKVFLFFAKVENVLKILQTKLQEINQDLAEDGSELWSSYKTETEDPGNTSPRTHRK